MTIAVVAVERWQDIVADLESAFTITGDVAVAKVLPVTQVIQQKLLNAAGLAANVSLPTTTLSETQTTQQTDSQLPTATAFQTQIQETKPGTAVQAAIDSVSGRTAAALPGIKLGTTLLQSNPLLQYQTALALFQEIKLLNRYVRSAPARPGYVPYLVRLQIGVTPHASRQPYDVYTRIAFFNDKASGSNPEVIPLVVTDDLEAMRQSQAAEIVRQPATNLSGTVQNAAVNAQLQALNDQLQAIVGNSLNSLSSVTRLADNTIQARFGAGNDPSMTGCRAIEYWFGCRSADRTMINRKYFVSLLLLVPERIAASRPALPVDMLAQTTLCRIYARIPQMKWRSASTTHGFQPKDQIVTVDQVAES